MAASMPETIAELYSVASAAMLERVDRKERGAKEAAAGVPHLTSLLEKTFFQAHSIEKRLIELEHIEAAALEMVDPARLKAIQWPVCARRAAVGDFVLVQQGLHAGQRGVVEADDGGWIPYRVKFGDGSMSGPIPEFGVLSSGMPPAEFEELYGNDARRVAVREACDEVLPPELRNALDCIRERVQQDRLPLLSLLQGDPLQMQSSHLSFQEFYCALALCKSARALMSRAGGGAGARAAAAGGGAGDDTPAALLLPKEAAPPWRFSAWWSNTLRLGVEMGDDFRIGLAYAAGLALDESGKTDSQGRPVGDYLDLKGKVGGDRPTSILAISEMMRFFASVDLTACEITNEEAHVLIGALAKCEPLQSLHIGYNQFSEATTLRILETLRPKRLNWLGLESLAIGVAVLRTVASSSRAPALRSSTSATTASLACGRRTARTAPPWGCIPRRALRA